MGRGAGDGLGDGAGEGAACTGLGEGAGLALGAGEGPVTRSRWGSGAGALASIWREGCWMKGLDGAGC